MTRSAIVLGLLLAPLCSATLSAQPTRTLDSDIALSGATSLEINVPVGEVELVGTGGDRLKAHLELTCPADDDGDCKNAASKVALNHRSRATELLLQVEGYPKLGGRGMVLRLKVEIPRALRVDADLGTGNLVARKLEGDLEIGLGVGDVTLELDRSRVRSVELDTGVGEAVLVVGGGRVEGSGLVSKGLEWSQEKGVTHVEVDTGVGDITVKLD